MSRHTAINTVRFAAAPRSLNVNWDSFFSPSPSVTSESPIDAFYEEHQGLTSLSGLVSTAAIVPNLRPILARQLVLGYVSATETYMRHMLAGAVALCPHVRRRAADLSISFSAVDFYAVSEIEHALFERENFSGEREIATALRNRLGIDVKAPTPLAAALSDFGKLCELRHAIVHSRGLVSSINARKVGYTAASRVHVQVDTGELLDVAAVCMNLVREVNDEAARSMLWEWIVGGQVVGRKRDDARRVNRLVSLFTSSRDAIAGTPGIPRGIDDLLPIYKPVVLAVRQKV